VPWQESSSMSERLAFVQQCIRRGTSIREVCAEFGISEKSGHKWLARFAAEGPAGLEDRSHARHTQARQMPASMAARIVALRKRHPLYGPEKLRDYLRQREPGEAWPAASTIGELLKREGLVQPRRRRGGTHARLANGRTDATAPNVVWTADFKGHFPLQHRGPYCYPLTVLDLHSHFLLGCTALPSTAVRSARQSFERLFREYGLPEVLRTDNGVPFAQPNAIGRLGALAFAWIRLGIRPEHTPPGRPDANGAHERFHKTLKAHTLRPPAASLLAQQRCFDRFRGEYNEERPHASLLEHLPPAATYQASPRPYPRRVPPMDYAEGTVVRRVSTAGAIKVRDVSHSLSRNLAGEYVSLRETDDDRLIVAYGPLELGEILLATSRFTANVRWTLALTPGD
jgi:putative transposase